MTTSTKVFKFHSLRSAQSFSSRTVKASAIIEGNDSRFWVVNLSTMEKLINQGYKLI